MYVVLGASGNTGHVVANNLLARGQKVRAVGRNAAHLQPLAAKGAETFIADVTDANALAKAFHQAEAAYVLIPPNTTSTDPLGLCESRERRDRVRGAKFEDQKRGCPQQHWSRTTQRNRPRGSGFTSSNKNSTRSIARMCSTFAPDTSWKTRFPR